MTHPMGIVDHCDVRLPEGLGRALDKMASEQKCTRSELIRRIICEAIDYYPPERAPDELPPQPVFKNVEVKSDENAPNACLDLFLRGWTATQIAAILRIPYKLVMQKIGADTDRLAASRFQCVDTAYNSDSTKSFRARSDNIPP